MLSAKEARGISEKSLFENSALAGAVNNHIIKQAQEGRMNTTLSVPAKDSAALIELLAKRGFGVCTLSFPGLAAEGTVRLFIAWSE